MAARGKSKRGKLAEYRQKRSADRTPEPFAAGGAERPGLFVVHKHAASHLHFDLRLEMGGVLQSWAVPKGPSLDPETKRLAMHVEDHPLEYGDFEGVIPEGNYGAGAVIVWDRGLWVPVKDPKHGIEQGKLLFDLYGHKLRGRWTLFRTKRGENDWLLVKKPDLHADADADEEIEQRSIYSGLTVEQLKAGDDVRAALRRKLRRQKARSGRVDPFALDLMLAQPADEPFSRDGWLFELKYDGYRLVAATTGDGPKLRYRRGQDVTERFPELTAALAVMPYEGLVLDGELVALDETGVPRFQRLQQRVQMTRPADIARASVQLPVVLFVFDLIAAEGFDLRRLPLTERKRLLREVAPPTGPIRYADHIERRGAEMFEQVRQMGLEGIVAKRMDARYVGRRSPDWLKLRADRTGDFVIVGMSPPKRARTGFGALHLAQWQDGVLAYAGRVGSGFDEKTLRELASLLGPSARHDPACRGELPRSAGHVWVEPEHVCEVRYKEWTGAGNLRQPVFLRLRDDKEPHECVRDLPGSDDWAAAKLEVEAQPEDQPRFSNLDKLFWPQDGYTKGDLIDYYRCVADRILPYLRDRPVVLTRYPDGIEGKNFFQKDAPDFAPGWIRTEKMWSQHAKREIHYFICNDERSLLYLANMATIPLHIWSSRVDSLSHPDWCILDLDPKDAPFEHVVKLAKALRALCRRIDLPSFVKTSGSSGLHVLIPLGGQCTYEQSRMLGRLLAGVIEREHHDIATTARTVSARKGRVYLDYLQNGHGRLLVSPLCVRPLPGAPVSTPLRWSEVNARLDIRKHTIKTVPRRLARMKSDPLLPVLDAKPDLISALARLQEFVSR